jgi:membrane associated rhomboid family serine protease
MPRKRTSLTAYPLLFGMVGLLWVVEILNLVVDHQLCRYGIFPRTARGLMGIPFSPILHGGVAHLFLNTGPLIVLGGLILFNGRALFIRSTVFIVLVGGLGIWLVGRPAYHVGASALIFGYFGYLLAKGFFDRRVRSIFLALVTIVAYGGLFWGLLPTVPHVSWEGHICGFAAGILAARSEKGRRG